MYLLGKLLASPTLQNGGAIYMPKPLPSQEYLNERLNYDDETGQLFWKERPVSKFSGKTPARAKSLCDLWNLRYANRPAFTYISSDGYHVGALDREAYKAHRIIWKMATGEEPENIDHIDGVRTNNTLVNLRAASVKENARNRAMPKTNTSGVIGVYLWDNGKHAYWVAQIAPEKQVYFSTFEEAVTARKAAEKAMGFHENHGRRIAALTQPIS